MLQLQHILYGLQPPTLFLHKSFDYIHPFAKRSYVFFPGFRILPPPHSKLCSLAFERTRFGSVVLKWLPPLQAILNFAEGILSVQTVYRCSFVFLYLVLLFIKAFLSFTHSYKLLAAVILVSQVMKIGAW